MLKYPFAVLLLGACLIGAGCIKAPSSNQAPPQTEGAASLNGTNLLVQLPPNWQVREASSDDSLYFLPNNRAWLAGPSDWLTPTPDVPREVRSFFVGCTITQIPLEASTNVEEWFSKNPIYSEENMWFLGSTSTFQTDHFSRGIVANEGSPNATRTTSIYIKTDNQFITRISFFNGADLDEQQRAKLPEIALGCQDIATSLQMK